MIGNSIPGAFSAGEQAFAHSSRAHRPRIFAGEATEAGSAAIWICFGIILLFFLGAIHWLRPASLFGYFHDDTLYFSSARALATGHGYIIESLPGIPPQTKYPILYSWLLSRVWKWSPQFPGNVMSAIWVTSLFGCLFLAAAFQFLRKMNGVGDWAALAIVAVISFEPSFLTFNAALLSDVPFMALALTAIVLADSGLRPERGIFTAALAGGLAGLSVNARTLGMATVVGILSIAIFRREYRKFLAAFLAAAPFVVLALWPTLSNFQRVMHGNLSVAGNPAWNQTMQYYVSYMGDWRNNITSFSMLFRLLKSTVFLLLACPAQYLLAPAIQPWSPGGMVIYLAVTLLVAAGMFRQLREEGWKPVHAVLPVYAAILLIWPYPQMERFLLLFLPLFLAGFYLETRRLGMALAKCFSSRAKFADKLLAGVFAVLLLGLAGFAAWNYAVVGRSEMTTLIENRRAILPEKQQAYVWVREHTSPETRIVAFEDVLLYLNTGRQAIRPISFRPSCCFTNDRAILNEDLHRIMEVPRHVHAAYWLMSDDYFSHEGSIPEIHAKIVELQAKLPLAFESSEGHVQIYDISGVVAASESNLRE
jgi:hypothetical protein